MFWLCSYAQGHNMLRAVVISWGACTLSVLTGNYQLPLPPVFGSGPPPATLNSLFALAVVIAVGMFLVTPLSYHENTARQPWGLADAGVIALLTAPAALAVLLLPVDLLMLRNIAAYLVVFFPVAAYMGLNAAVVSLTVWLIAQCAFYDPYSGPLARIFTIVLQENPTVIEVSLLAAAAVIVGMIFRRKIKQQGRTQ